MTGKNILSVWIGLNRRDDGITWKWLNGDLLSNGFWTNGSPDLMENDCSYMILDEGNRNKYLLTDNWWSCDSSEPYALCEIPCGEFDTRYGLGNMPMATLNH